MAEDEASEGEEEQQGGSKKRLILLIVLCLIIAGISVGGTLVALKMFGEEPPPAEGEGAEGAEAEPTAPPAPAIYYPIKPEIIVTYQARGRQRYMQAEINLLVRSEDVIAAIELHMPMVRNALNLIMGSQAYEDVQTAEGKELMRQNCLQELQKIIEKETGSPGVEQVLFTNLVLQ